MSTIFEVHPSKEYIPTYNEVLNLSNRKINSFLTSLGVCSNRIVKCNLKKCHTHENIEFSLNDRARWLEGNYLWFCFPGIAGGCDAYFNNFSEFDKNVWEDEISTNPRAKRLEKQIRDNLNIGFEWRFRRSAGQPAIINLSYGLIAASFAELTDGIIYSDDGAWDYDMLPANYEDFLINYFNPDYEKQEYSSWARECIEIITKEFK